MQQESKSDSHLVRLLVEAREYVQVYVLVRQRKKGCDSMGELATIKEECRGVIDKVIQYSQERRSIFLGPYHMILMRLRTRSRQGRKRSLRSVRRRPVCLRPACRASGAGRQGSCGCLPSISSRETIWIVDMTRPCRIATRFLAPT